MIDVFAHGYRFSLHLAGIVCEVETNYCRLGFTLRHWTVAASEGNVSGRLAMQVLVAACAAPPAERPHFRGLHHVVIGPKVGVVPVHCACLCLNGAGVLVAGASGAGKSTLSAALVQSGFDYVSDDWTYIGRHAGRLLAHGMSARIKLLPDAIAHFPQLEGQPLMNSMNGELAYEVAADWFGGDVFRSCEPRWCIFLERSARLRSSFAPMDPKQARWGFLSSVERLPDQLADATRARSGIIDQVGALPCWTFRCGGTPQFAAQEILAFVSSQKQELTA
jgi:hypothetical protein